MTKRQLIDEIALLNPTAKPGFLAQFNGEDLGKYLRQLQAVRAPGIPAAQSGSSVRPAGQTGRRSA